MLACDLTRTSGWTPGKPGSLAAAGKCSALTSVCPHSHHVISLGWQGLGILYRESTRIPVSQWLQDTQKCLAEEGEASAPAPAGTLSASTESMDKVPVVKAKATRVIMNSLITKQTQESIQRFEQQAGLRDAGYTPHKGLTTEENKYLRVAEALHKLKLQSGELTREERPASAQSTPSSSPHSSPKQGPRGWFTSGSSAALPGPSPSALDPGGGDKDRSSAEKWSLFGPRPLQKSDSGGFAVQAYRGAQKPSPMELMRAQATRMAEDPATFKPPKMDIPVMEGKKPPARSHHLKPRDLNVLTPSGF
uniref:Putative monooxygenase p33MONOX n=1 Tax=Oryctolagus cuniculus TaxID=9986 RepID=A0A5F9D9M8_RABIT